MNEARWPRFLIEPIRDLYKKAPSHGQNLSALDGLRGLAVAIVLMDHTHAFHNTDRGFFGVVLFFVLSGFLLTMPFVQKADLVPNFKFITQYLIRRVKRIYPLYFICLTAQYYVFYGIIADAVPGQGAFPKLLDYLRAISFHTVGGHFWSIAQEMYFYILLPLVFLTNYYILKKRLVPILLFLLACILLSLKYGNNPYIYINWVNFQGKTKLAIQAQFFLSGVATCYLAHWLTPRLMKSTTARIVTSLASLVAVAILVGANEYYINKFVVPIPLFGAFLAKMLFSLSSQNYAEICCILLLSILINQRGLVGKIFSLVPLRALGVVGYSMYLVHPYVLAFCRIHAIDLGDIPEVRFLVVLLIAYLVSSVTYTYIEKPFSKADYRATLTKSYHRLKFFVRHMISLTLLRFAKKKYECSN